MSAYIYHSLNDKHLRFIFSTNFFYKHLTNVAITKEVSERDVEVRNTENYFNHWKLSRFMLRHSLRYN